MVRQSTGDIRSTAKGYQRDKNHSVKWAKGARAAPGRPCTHNLAHHNSPCSACAARPLKKDPHATEWRDSKLYKKTHQVLLAKRVLVNDADDAAFATHVLSDTSDEEITDPSAAPEEEQDVMYSYDAHTGPNSGNDLLSHAVLQAVKKYENKQTEQLVKREYDLVSDTREFEDSHDAEDDFELIDHAHLA